MYIGDQCFTLTVERLCTAVSTVGGGNGARPCLPLHPSRLWHTAAYDVDAHLGSSSLCCARRCGLFIPPPHTHTHTHTHPPLARSSCRRRLIKRRRLSSRNQGPSRRPLEETMSPAKHLRLDQTDLRQRSGATAEHALIPAPASSTSI